MSYSAVRPEPPHNNRYSYQTGSCPGFVLGISLAALLLGFSSLSHAASGGMDTPALNKQHSSANHLQ